MRLTVRTLLAWIDEVLGPAEHGELAAKVASSPVARPLIERIRSAVESPAVSAPPPAGRGLADDPNTAAEFLDNVLDGERLAAFERVCIDSDLHLADVAGCHRVLAELHRDPAALEMFAAASGRAALGAARQAGAVPTIETAAPRRGVAPRAAAPAASGRRGTPWWAWLSAAVALLLIVALGGVLLSLTGGRSGRARDGATAVAETPAPEVKPDPVPVPAPEAPPAAAALPPAAALPSAKPLPAVEPRPVEAAVVVPPTPRAPTLPEPDAAPSPAPPVGLPEPSPPSEATAAPAAPPAARTVPHGEAMAIGGGVAEPPASPSSVDPPVPVAGKDTAAAGEAAAAFRLIEGAVVLPAADGGAWRSMTSSGAIDPAVERLDVLAPAGVYPLLTVDGVAARLQPGTRAVVSRRTQAAPVIEIVHGRAVIAADGGDSWPLVKAGGLHGELGLIPGQPAGVEVAFTRPQGSGPGIAGLGRAAIFSAGSALVWRQAPASVAPQQLVGIPAEVLIPAATSLRWDALDPAAARPEPCPAPAWMAEALAADRIGRGAAADVVAALAAAPPDAAGDVLRRLAAGGLPETRGRAAATLASLGEPAALVDLLCDDPPRGLSEAQWTALEAATVPVVLARGGPEAEALLAAFRERAPDGAVVAGLAAGPDAEVGGDATALVAGLDAGALVVRRYSIRRLRDLAAAVGQALPDDYRADRDATARRDSVARWRALAEEGALRRRAIPEPARSPGPNGR